MRNAEANCRMRERTWEDFSSVLTEALVRECMYIYPTNPPDVDRCMELHKKMKKWSLHNIKEGIQRPWMYIYVEKKEEGMEEMVSVTVRDDYVWENDIYDYPVKELASMRVVINGNGRLRDEEALAWIYFYVLYPLRVDRQRKRDEVKQLATVIKEYSRLKEQKGYRIVLPLDKKKKYMLTKWEEHTLAVFEVEQFNEMLALIELMPDKKMKRLYSQIFAASAVEMEYEDGWYIPGVLAKYVGGDERQLYYKKYKEKGKKAAPLLRICCEGAKGEDWKCS